MWLPCGYLVVTLWLPCGYHVVTLWLPCVLLTMWLPCGSSASVLLFWPRWESIAVAVVMSNAAVGVVDAGYGASDNWDLRYSRDAGLFDWFCVK